MKFVGKIGAVLLLFCCATPASGQDSGDQPALAAAPQGVADPVDYVRSVYRQYMAGGGVIDPGFAYSAELSALIAAAEREQKDKPGRLDFDFWVGGQDWVIPSVDISELPGSNGRRIVVARFQNQSVPALIHFHFIDQSGRWFLDDVENLDGPSENRWRLRRILTEPPIAGGEAEWEIFHRGKDGSIGAIRKPVDFRNGVLSAEVRATQWEPEDSKSQGLFSVEIDCIGKRGRMMHGRVTDGNGKTETRDEPEDWAAIVPDTPAAALHAKYCAGY